MTDKHFDEIRSRLDEVTTLMSTPEVATDPGKMAELGREHSRLEPIAKAIDRFEKLSNDLADLKEMQAAEDDQEMAQMVVEEIRKQVQSAKVKAGLVPKGVPREVIEELRRFGEET